MAEQTIHVSVIRGLPKNNLVAIVPPANTDDISKGYSIGSIWIDTNSYTNYTCVDATLNSAIQNSSSGGTGGSQDATVNIRLDELEKKLVIYSIPNKKIKNRYMHLIPNIPSNLAGFNSENISTLKKISISCENIYSDSTIIIEDDNNVVIKEVIISFPNKKYVEETNINIDHDTNLKVLLKSISGVDYPVVKLELV